MAGIKGDIFAGLGGSGKTGFNPLSLASTALSFFGGGKSKRDKSYELAERQVQFQENMARSGIQWRVRDAKKAGVHPLYALGNSPSFSPVQYLGGAGSGSDAAHFSDLGQNLSRAFRANQTKPERAESTALKNLALERAGLQNELLRAQIAKINQPDTPPAPQVAPPQGVMPGQESTVDVEANPQHAVDPSRPSVATGQNPAFQWLKSTGNRYILAPSQYAKDATEEQFWPNLQLQLEMWRMSPEELRKIAPIPPGYKIEKDFWTGVPTVVPVFEPRRKPRRFRRRPKSRFQRLRDAFIENYVRRY